MSRRDQRNNPPKTEAHRKAQEAYADRQAKKVVVREVNAEVRAKRTPQQQLEHLNWMFGTDLGAVRERARLMKQL